MNCEKCGVAVPDGEEREHFDKTLCEDCYMDALSPARTCDPWAVHSAKSFSGASDMSSSQMNNTQKTLLGILKETGGIEPSALLKKIGITESEFQREIATLRHMEKVRAEMRDGVKIMRLW
ncbi:MAG: hypothetical protein PHS86_14000 [Syntrophaceae bacterium]|nr:hypothetical protein [Syntrophaceae bacterium]